MWKVLWAIILLVLLPTASFESPKIEIKETWVREVPPISSVTAVYMVIENKGNEDDRLIEINTDAANSAELHATLIDEKDIVRMERFKYIDIPSNKSIELKPGGPHIMLIGLKKPLKEGVKIELNLKFEKSGIIKVQAQVKR
jgi:hypothetical protein